MISGSEIDERIIKKLPEDEIKKIIKSTKKFLSEIPESLSMKRTIIQERIDWMKKLIKKNKS